MNTSLVTSSASACWGIRARTKRHTGPELLGIDLLEVLEHPPTSSPAGAKRNAEALLAFLARRTYASDIAIGRPATALRLVRQTNPGIVRTEVYFDPETSATLARRIVTSEGELTSTDSRVYTPLTTVPSRTRP